ncbi:MAG: hypothetical protein AABZ14_00870, partial [Candidatus Margulisiibacteriota bacterium]
MTSDSLFRIKKDIISPTCLVVEDIAIASQNLWYKQAPAWISSVNIDFFDEGGSQIGTLSYGIQSTSSLLMAIITKNINGIASYTDLIGISWNLLVNGTNNIFFRVEDRAGNIITTSVLFMLKKDNSIPSYQLLETISQPSQDFWYKSAPYFLSSVHIRFTDEGGSQFKNISYGIQTGNAIQLYTITDNQNGFYSYENLIVISWDTLSNGTNNVVIRLEDFAENVLTSSTLFFVKKDIVLPLYEKLVTVSTEDQSRWYNSQPSWSIGMGSLFYDNSFSLLRKIDQVILTASGIARIETVYNGIAIPTFNSSWGVSWNNLENGVNDLYVRLEDYATNVTTTNKWFTLKKDLIAPTILNTETSTFTGWFGGSISKLNDIGVFFSDSHSHVQEISYTISNNGVITTLSYLTRNADIAQYVSSWSIQWSDILGGSNEVNVSVTDNSGNNRRETLFTIRRDMSAPVVTMNQVPTQQATWYSQPPAWSQSVNVQVIDQESLLASLGYDISANQSYISLSLSTNINTATYNVPWAVSWNRLPDEGESRVYLRATNNAGMVMVSPLFFIRKDILLPSVENLETPSDNKFLQWSNVGLHQLDRLSINVYEKGSGINAIRYGAQIGTGSVIWQVVTTNQNMATYNQGIAVDWAMLSQGQNNLYLLASDNATNRITVNLGLTVRKDQIAPSYNDSASSSQERLLWWSLTPNWLNNLTINFVDQGGSGLKEIGYTTQIGAGASTYSLITQNNAPMATSNYAQSWAVGFSTLNNGINDLRLVIRDHAGNEVTTDVVFHIYKDTLSPTYNNKMTDFSGWYNDARKPDLLNKVSVNFNDVGLSGLSALQYGVSNNGAILFYTIAVGLATPTYDQTFAVNWTYLLNGTNDIAAKVKDNAGNTITSNKLFRVYKDNLPPSYSFLQLITADVWYNTMPSWMAQGVSCSFSDQGYSQIATIQYSVLNSDGLSSYGVTSNVKKSQLSLALKVNWTTLTNGVNEVMVSVSDFAQNQTTSSVFFTVRKDIVSPSVLNNESSSFDVWYKESPDWLNH